MHPMRDTTKRVDRLLGDIPLEALSPLGVLEREQHLRHVLDPFPLRQLMLVSKAQRRETRRPT